MRPGRKTARCFAVSKPHQNSDIHFISGAGAGINRNQTSSGNGKHSCLNKPSPGDTATLLLMHADAFLTPPMPFLIACWGHQPSSEKREGLITQGVFPVKRENPLWAGKVGEKK
jgi:hypothetical protein